MTTQVVIGVGGAGSKAVEAFLYLSAAGIGTREEVKIGIVDQDQTNGSVSAAEKTIVDYYTLRNRLRTGGDDLGVSDLFSGAVRFDPVKLKWCPALQNDETISKLLGFPTEQDGQLRDLFSALFEPGANEMMLPLNEGFRGRPFLGAAVMTHRAQQAIAANEGLWGELRRLVEDQTTGDMHCVLVGSIFGGTGASGLPTIAKQLREMSASTGTKIRISTVLLLPYFSYVDEVTGRVAARSAESLSRAGNALRYYAEIIEEDVVPLFDHAYLVGWKPSIELRFKADGGPDQKNPPMIAELLAALGVSRLLVSELESDQRKAFSLLGRSKNESFGWADMPETAVDSQTRESLRQFVRFCLAYRYFYNDALQGEPRPDLWRERAEHELRIDFKDAGTKETLDAVASFCERFLQWSVALQWADPVPRIAEDPRAIDLLNADSFAARLSADDPSLQDAQLRARLRPPGDALAHRNLAASFTGLFTFKDAHARGPSLAQIFYRFSNGPRPKRSQGIGALLGSLYAACAN